MIGKLELKQILEDRFSNDLHKTISEIPLPSQLKDIYKAANRIKSAIDNGEKIAVVGDYDVDGIVSSVILAEFLQLLNANFIIKIPNRFTEGYGLNVKIIKELPKDIALIITVDNGIASVEAANLCLKLGIDLIITDHHMPPEILPAAFAIVNPKQKDCTFPNIEICGAQVAWYLTAALKDIFKLHYDMSQNLDLLIVAIIADMMELRDMNRILLKAGIKKLNLSKRPCLRVIKEYYGNENFSFDDIGFKIAPLINCTGRMANAELSYKFLYSKDIREANSFFDMIVKLNNIRKEEEKNLYEISLADVKDTDEIIVTWGKDWHEGVIGIVAARLANYFKKPAIVFSVDNDKAKGSARSIGKFNIFQLISQNSDLLISYGGHKSAAGIVIETKNLEAFKASLNSSCFLQDLGDVYNHFDELLGEIDISEFDEDMLEIIEYYEPYGQKNPKPIFEIKNALVTFIRLIGREQNHMKITIEKNGVQKDAIFFNFDKKIFIGEYVNLIVSVTKNSFKGVITPEFIVQKVF